MILNASEPWLCVLKAHPASPNPVSKPDSASPNRALQRRANMLPFIERKAKASDSANNSESAVSVLLLHGVGGCKETWATLSQHSDLQHLRVVAVDLRGHGSATVTAPFDVSTMARDVLEAIDALALSPVVVVGQSMGARVAVAVAALSRAVVGLVLGDMDMAPRRPIAIQDGTEEFVRIHESRNAALEHLALHHETERSSRIFPDGDHWRIAFHPWGAAQAHNAILASEDALDKFQALPQELPIRLIVADTEGPEQCVTRTGLQTMLNLHPKLDVQVVPGSSHQIYKTHPSEFAAHISQCVDIADQFAHSESPKIADVAQPQSVDDEVLWSVLLG